MNQHHSAFMLTAESISKIQPFSVRAVILDVISGIDVLAYNINIFVTRIPVGTLTVIDPDKIVTAVCIRKLVIKVFPELFVSVGTLCAPPEPTA